MTDILPQNQGRVLVLDPDRARCARRCAKLILNGWHTVQACHEADALAAVRAGEVDLVLLQVDPDVLEAEDLPNVLRLAADIPYLPVVVVAARPSEAMRCRFLDSGADDVVDESISPAELTSRLRALMRAKILQDELRISRAALSASLARERALLAQLRRDNAHLLTLCTTDPLTRLQNVRHFDSFLESQFKIARRYRRPLSALVLDIDHFKVVNDTHGHPCGDYVLKEVAVILKRSVRDSDFVARTGGEEFSIILPNTGRAQTRRFAQRIRKAVRAHCFGVHGRDIRVTTSVGTACYGEDPEITDAHMLVYFADQALLRAKQQGRDRVIAFHELDEQTRSRLRRQFTRSRPSRYRAKLDQALLADARR